MAPEQVLSAYYKGTFLLDRTGENFSRPSKRKPKVENKYFFMLFVHAAVALIFLCKSAKSPLEASQGFKERWIWTAFGTNSASGLSLSIWIRTQAHSS